MVHGPTDGLVADILGRCGYRFTIAADEAARTQAYRLRAEAVIRHGCAPAEELPGGLEHDAYDAQAVHLLAWRGEDLVATGRLIFPPHPLPTEDLCGLQIEPRGGVVDVGRMAVAAHHQNRSHGAFLALLARLYTEVRQRGYTAGCGLVSPRARGLMRLLGLPLEVLGPERPHWGEPRAPVRFAITGESTHPVVGPAAQQ